MGIDLFGKKAIALLTKETTKLQLQVKSLQGSRIVDALSYVNTAIYPTWGIWEEIQKYVTNDDIYSIISLIAESAATIPYYGYKVKDDSALKQYKKWAELTLQKKHWKIKAMEDLPEADKFHQFLESPFYGKGKYTGWVASYSYYLSAGECFYYKMDRLKFGPNKGVGKLVILPPQNVIVLLTLDFPQKVAGYRLNYRGEIFDFDPDEVIHVRSFNPTYYNGNEWRGMSAIRALCERLTRMQANMDNSVAQMQNGGTPSLVYDKKDGTAGEDEISVSGQRKDKFARFLKNKANKGAPFFADGDMGVLQLGSNLVDLDSLNMAKADFDKCCNAFHVSSVLFNDTSAGTENNVEIQTKRMWTQAALPLCTVFKDAFIQYLLPDFPGIKRYVDVDISGVRELQKDLKWQAEALQMMWWVTPNEKRDVQGWDMQIDENMDKILVDSNKIFLEDVGMDVQPTDNTDDYGDA